MNGFFLPDEVLSCGCRLRHLEGGNSATELLHQKDRETLDAYNRLFFEFFPLFCPRRTVEIGVHLGGSLAMWNARFRCSVVGIDLEDKISGQMKKHVAHSAVSLLVGDATNASWLSGAVRDADLVIDDGSHRFKDIVATFGVLWDCLSSGGLYIIEDWRSDEGCYAELAQRLLSKQIGYWPDKKPPAGAPRSILYFREIIVLEKQ